MSYFDLFDEGNISFLDSHSPVGLWEDGAVDQFESGDIWVGQDPYASFGGIDVGATRSSTRNRAFEVLKKISAAIGHPRSFSADKFRGMTRFDAGKARREVADALKRWARDNNVSLSNPLDPLATYTTANTNLGKVRGSEAAIPPAPAPPPTDPAANPGNVLPTAAAPGMFQPPAQGTGPDPRGIYIPDSGPPAPPPPTVWKNPWVWAGLVAGFGVLGLGAYLIFGRD